MKQRRKNRQLDGTVRSNFKYLYVLCMYLTTSINAKLQKERTDRKEWLLCPFPITETTGKKKN